MANALYGGGRCFSMSHYQAAESRFLYFPFLSTNGNARVLAMVAPSAPPDGASIESERCSKSGRGFSQRTVSRTSRCCLRPYPTASAWAKR